MKDALRALAGDAGFREADRGASGRDQPGAASAAQERTLEQLADAGAWHADARRRAGRPGHHRRQRILRRPAGQSGGEDGTTAGTSGCIGIDADGKLAFAAAPEPLPHFEHAAAAGVARRARRRRSSNGATTSPPCELGRRIADDGGAALVIDYGHVESDAGDTLQAVGQHAYADPLTAPGELDITAHVDFQALRARPRRWAQGARPDRAGAIPAPPRHRDPRRHAQGRKRRRARAADIDHALARLIGHGRTGMGALFKVAAFAHPSLGVPPGFDHETLYGLIVALALLSPRLPSLQSTSLAVLPDIRHAFFTRSGGVSRRRLCLAQRRRRLRRRARQRRGKPRAHGGRRSASRPSGLLTPYQIHSPDVVVAEEPWTHDARPRADAVVTRTPGLAIGVSTADCGPLLFADDAGRRHRRRACRLARRLHRRDRGDRRRDGKARRRSRTHRRRRSGPPSASRTTKSDRNSSNAFLAADADNARFFSPPQRDGHAMFDLTGYIADRVCSTPALPISRISGSAPMPSPSASSAIRRTTQRGEPDYGRHINAIALAD